MNNENVTTNSRCPNCGLILDARNLTRVCPCCYYDISKNTFIQVGGKKNGRCKEM